MSDEIKQASKNLELDQFGQPIPQNLELNTDLLQHMFPNETNEHDLPYYRLKQYLRYKTKPDDKEIIKELQHTRLNYDVFSVRQNRQDIHCKKILRSFTQYYLLKLERKTHYMNMRKKIKRTYKSKKPKLYKFMDYVD